MGENIKLKPEAIRVNIGMTQEEFVKELGMSVRVYLNRVNHKTKWQYPEIVKLCELGKISFEQLEI